MAKGQTAGLRVRAARGTMITAAFEAFLQALGFLKGFVIAAFLTQSEYGLWGILVITIGTLTWLKEIGVSEKFVQQDEEDQERAFQKAFTFDLLTNGLLMLLMLALLPVFALLYHQWSLIAPGLLIIFTLPAYSFKAPMWIFYREMQYGRQRALEAADPVTAFVVSVALAASGVGYWSLVIGLCAGVWVGAATAVWASPYKLRLVFDKGTAREYFSFSWPLFVASASGLLIPQASMLAGNAAVGLAGVGAIALAGSVSVWTDKVDQIVTWTLYPAICRVKDRVDLLYEAFVKTNRLTLMWGIPFGIGLALFIDDLVQYVIGSHWSSAVPLIQVFGIIAALNHIGFNWSAFYRARGETKPLALVAPVVTGTFLAVALPGLFLWGLKGYAIGMATMASAYLMLRTYYLRKLFTGFRMLPHAARALAPTVPAVAVVLGARLLETGTHTAGMAVAEFVAYVVVTVVLTVVFERALLLEVLGYVRGRGTPVPTVEPLPEAVPGVPARA